MGDQGNKHSFINDALEQRRASHQFRRLNGIKPVFGTSEVIKNGKRLINFCSNDYLGLSHHPLVLERAKKFTEKYGTGSGASRLVSGTLDIHQELEEKLANSVGFESALLFNSGFQANTSLLPVLAGRNSLILTDRKVHNSLIQGALLSRATFKRFDHNNTEDLQQLIEKAEKQHYDRVWVVSETVFSMDGDRSPLDDLISLCDEYELLLYSDDAHALGVLGDDGMGLNAGKKGIDINLGTFGKSFGAFGAFAGCSREMREYLVNFSAGFIYSTALPPAVIGAVDASLELIPQLNTERKELFKKINRVRSELNAMGYETGQADSQIIPVIIGAESETMHLSEFLENEGIWASAIRPPTIEKGASRIRLTLSVSHTDENIDQLLNAFRSWITK